MLINEFPNDTKEQIKEKNNYFTNMFILRHNIDRICCRSVFITFNDYVPSTM
jgi:DNA-directed RNA polymerase subunit N (RpoN/RPB10)